MYFCDMHYMILFLCYEFPTFVFKLKKKNSLKTKGFHHTLTLTRNIWNISLPQIIILALVYYHIHCSLVQFSRARRNSVKLKSNNNRLNLCKRSWKLTLLKFYVQFLCPGTYSRGLSLIDGSTQGMLLIGLHRRCVRRREHQMLQG